MNTPPAESFSPPVTASRQPTGLLPAGGGTDWTIQTMRGLAILLVVVFHVRESLNQWGFLSNDHALSQLVDAMSFVRMPLFTVISGYVYALRPVRLDVVKPFVVGKLRRVGLPLISVGLLLLLDHAVGVGVADLPALAHSIWLNNGSYLWYLEALLWLFALTMLLELTGVLNRFGGWLSVWLLLLPLGWWFAAARRFDEPYTFLALGNTVYLAPFFFLGIGLLRYRHRLLCRPVYGSAVILLVIYTILHHLFYVGGGFVELPSMSHKAAWLLLSRDTVSMVMGTTAPIVLLGSGLVLTPLVRLGQHAYAIYLFHDFGYRWPMLGLTRGWGVESLAVLLTVGMVGGLLLPIGLSHLLRRFSWLHLIFLGKRVRRNENKSVSPTAGSVAGRPPTVAATPR